MATSAQRLKSSLATNWPPILPQLLSALAPGIGQAPERKVSLMRYPMERLEALAIAVELHRDVLELIAAREDREAAAAKLAQRLDDQAAA